MCSSGATCLPVVVAIFKIYYESIINREVPIFVDCVVSLKPRNIMSNE